MDLAKSARRIEEDMEQLALCSDTPGEGITRLPFTAAARRTVDTLVGQMRSAGLSVREDAAGNLIGRLEGRDPEAPAILIGSHYDSVPHGGNFDGMAGIEVGIELVRMLREEGIVLEHPIEVIGTVDEEGVRFGTGYFGVDAMMGSLDEGALDNRRDAAGIRLADAMRSYGLDPERIGEARRAPGSIAAWLEVHVEQGRVLEASGKRIGIVEGIVGIRHLDITILGMADHAGATPMDLRVDAVEAAAKIIGSIGDFAREVGAGTVATVGIVDVMPGAYNVIAERCRFTVDIRALESSSIEWVAAAIRRRTEEVCDALGARFEWTVVSDHPQVRMDAALQNRLTACCERRGLSYRSMPSGAGHDSIVMAQVVPAAMLFIPSREGRSHAPVEWSDYRDMAEAAAILFDLLTGEGSGV